MLSSAQEGAPEGEGAGQLADLIPLGTAQTPFRGTLSPSPGSDLSRPPPARCRLVGNRLCALSLSLTIFLVPVFPKILPVAILSPFGVVAQSPSFAFLLLYLL